MWQKCLAKKFAFKSIQNIFTTKTMANYRSTPNVSRELVVHVLYTYTCTLFDILIMHNTIQTELSDIHVHIVTCASSHWVLGTPCWKWRSHTGQTRTQAAMVSGTQSSTACGNIFHSLFMKRYVKVKLWIHALLHKYMYLQCTDPTHTVVFSMFVLLMQKFKCSL